MTPVGKKTKETEQKFRFVYRVITSVTEFNKMMIGNPIESI